MVSAQRNWLKQHRESIYAVVQGGLDASVLEVILLVAPPEVGTKSVALMQKVVLLEQAVFSHEDDTATERLHDELAQINQNLRTMMRADISVATVNEQGSGQERRLPVPGRT
ncbi:hypothetical protein GCM10010210_49240 [Pseudonocardia hydrocarbonoxydans]|uniref:Uncharacterized protein n=1 Tax=Pseudonocardia hydrocarbonoxydans TaxID=76726 RepID=A0A4Y3WTI2_9PSEU|nr:hypothetical protein PHY01_44880 [Pseudonocardia hydrocarbonoxydans]